METEDLQRPEPEPATETDTEPEPPARDGLAALDEVFAKALRAQGFSDLTTVQSAVLAPELEGRDLRICSQTGSGKTVALGFVVGATFLDGGPVVEHEDGKPGPATPQVLLIAPTRDLAAQLGKELSWLFGGLHLGIAVVTGGTAVDRDLRALSAGPEVVVGTPGRLVDLLERGVLDLSKLESVVLDEADEMLDMGFREELESILDQTPPGRSTHMATATFSPRVDQLADRYQSNAILVEGTVGLGHQDISHSAILVDVRNRIGVLVNLLLLHPDQRLLVFVRTRVAASGVAGELSAMGFSASALSGEMAQRERARCLADFRARKLQCVVATDVASRGLDIRGVQRILHFDLPESIEAFTHRSGRTGRAGEKGESILLVAPRDRQHVERLFRITGIDAQWRSAPTPAKIRRAGRRRLVRKYGARAKEDAPQEAAQNEGGASSKESAQAPSDMTTLAETLLEQRSAIELVAELLADVASDSPAVARTIPEAGRGAPVTEHRPRRAGPGSGPRARNHGGRFDPFHVTWGSNTGANPQRLLAHICRRAGIDGSRVGAMKIHDFFSVVDIASDVAESFERAVAPPDKDNPKVHIRRFVPSTQRKGKKR